MRYLQVLLGGAAGSLLRYLIGIFIAARYPGRFPLGTFLINVTGSFLIGVVLQGLNAGWRPLLVSGVLGGYTTFSSFAWESFEAIEKEQIWIGLANIVLSVVLGYLAVWCGSWVARAFR